jgi:hypothetical protein
MPFDLVAFYESQQATALAGVAAVADDIYRTNGDDLYVQAVASFLAGVLHSGATTPKYMEIRQPDLKIPHRFNKAVIQEGTSGYCGWTDLKKRPLPLFPAEKLNVYLQNASNEASLVVLALASGATSQAQLDAVRPTHMITGYADQALSAGVWTKNTLTWDQSLPAGRYAIVGMRAAEYKAANPMIGAARLILLDTTWRVGVPFSIMTGDKTLDIYGSYDVEFDRFPLMPDISFNHDQMPATAEVISAGADTDLFVNLMLQKIK